MNENKTQKKKTIKWSILLPTHSKTNHIILNKKEKKNYLFVYLELNHTIK